MAKISRQAREELAAIRLLRVLAKHGIANARTLEQKISDAGPFNQRIDPHVLTPVRKRLIAEGSIGIRHSANAPWYYAANTPANMLDERLNEQLPIYQDFVHLGLRSGQTLEIATYRALCAVPGADFNGRFRDLDAHDDSKAYSKEEPEQHIGARSLVGDERLDFIIRTKDAGPLGVECKNVRHWLYPHVEEISEILRKCLALDAVPVIIARRIPFVTFSLLSRCGVIFHQTYNQLLPSSDADLAAKVRHKNLLAYHDIRTGNEPDARMTKFIGTNIWNVAAAARSRFEEYKDLLEPFSTREMSYEQFAARVRRRTQGTNEDNDFDEDRSLSDFTD